MAENCIFCQIAAGEIPAEKMYEDDRMLAIKDLNPAAPCHVLLLPKEHSSNILEAGGDIVGYMVGKLPEITRKLGIDETGFRFVANTGSDGGQTVGHLHFHLLGGRSLGWPPG